MSPPANRARAAWPVRLSSALYAPLLGLFPRSFRMRFGADLREAFSDVARTTWLRRGATGLVRLWGSTLVDLSRGGAAERIAAWRQARAGSGRRHRAAAALRRSPDDEATHMDTLTQDIRFALRSLRRAPGLTAAIVATIALGIGANTAIFTVVNGIVLRPLPFPGSENAVILCETHEMVGDYCIASPPQVRDFESMSDALVTAGLARTWTFALRDDEGTTPIRAGIASPGFLRVYGIEPAMGRLLSDEDMPDGDNRVIVLTHGLWQSRFGGDPEIIGRQVSLDADSFTVIGVLPPDAWTHVFRNVEAWAPLTSSPENTDQRDWRGFVSVGLLGPDASLAQARQELEGVRAALESEYPDVNRGWGLEIEPIRDHVSGPVRTTLLLFLGAVGLVLLIGCANVANLLLARATQRTDEFAVRSALGAGRGRIVRQLLTESLIVALGGGLLGFALAVSATRGFLALAPSNIPRLGEVGVDLAALGFALALSALTAAIFGLAPAWRAADTDINETLKSSRHGDSRAGALRSSLVVAEIALAVMLLVGAGLLTRGFASLLRWDPGFDDGDLVTVWAGANFGNFETGQQIVDMFDRVAAEMRTIPGVVAVGQTSAGPLFGGIETSAVVVEGRPVPPPEQQASVRWYDMDTEYFATMGIPILRGRSFGERDDQDSVRVAIINETMARQHWPDGDPLGQRVTVDETTWEVVGIARDVRPFRPDQRTGPEIYWPRKQFTRGGTFYVLRSDVGLASLERQVQDRLEQFADDLRLSSFTPMEERTAAELVSPRFNMTLVGLFAAVAVALAAIGTYGVMSYSVASRTHEIGVRIAIGARPASITTTVLRSGLALALVGVMVGLSGAFALARFLASLLYGIPPADPLTYVGVALLFLVVAVGACWVPARRASGLDPMNALRTE